jgi:hypothetical protein
VTRTVHILRRSMEASALSHHSALLASYGLTAKVHSIKDAYAADRPGAAWLTFERSCIPVLALLSPPWSVDNIGAFASLTEPEHLRDFGRHAGLTMSEEAHHGIEGYVWDGRFFPAASSLASPAEQLVKAAQSLCAAFQLRRAYLRMSVGQDGKAIVDAQIVPGDAAAISRARQAGICPIWTAYSLATARRPLIPVLATEARLEAIGA